MNDVPDTNVSLPIRYALLYPREGETAPIRDLGLTHLLPDYGVEEDTDIVLWVTPREEVDPYGVQISMDLMAARQLVKQLSLIVGYCETQLSVDGHLPSDP